MCWVALSMHHFQMPVILHFVAHRAGFSAKDDRLPEYFKKESLPPHNVRFAVEDSELDEMYNF